MTAEDKKIEYRSMLTRILVDYGLRNGLKRQLEVERHIKEKGYEKALKEPYTVSDEIYERAYTEACFLTNL